MKHDLGMYIYFIKLYWINKFLNRLFFYKNYFVVTKSLTTKLHNIFAVKMFFTIKKEIHMTVIP